MTIAGTKDSIRPHVFPVQDTVPESGNTFGYRVFALPIDSLIEFSTHVTSWIAHLPNDLIFHGQKNPDDKTSWMVSFDEIVIVVSDGESNLRTRFLKPDGREVPIQSNDNLPCLIAAFETERETIAWTVRKTTELINSQSAEVS